MNRIQERREALGMSREELADKAGITRQAVWNLETGRCDGMSKTMLAIAKALDTTVDALFA